MQWQILLFFVQTNYLYALSAVRGTRERIQIYEYLSNYGFGFWSLRKYNKRTFSV